MKRVACYYRVSSGEQSNEPQRLELLEYCQRKGWTEVKEYADKISGAKFTRIGLDMMMADVKKGKVDVVLCVKLDRLGRSLPHLAQLIGRLKAERCALICTSQPIDTTSDNPCGELTMGILMVMAQFERSLIQERTRAGLAVARANGKTLGRPRFVMKSHHHLILEHWLSQSATERVSLQALGEHLGCSKAKAHALTKEGT